MLKLYDLVCPQCGFSCEEYVEYNVLEHKIVEDILCEKCHTLMETSMRDPMYSKHGSWSAWNIEGSGK